MSVHNTTQYIKSQNFSQKELFEIAKWCVSKIQKRMEICEECGELSYDYIESHKILCVPCYNEIGSIVSGVSSDSSESDDKSIELEEN
jgi:hypothetical protein